MMNEVKREESSILIIATVFLLLITTVNIQATIAQPTEFWYKTYYGGGQGWPSGVQTTDGGYAIAGTIDTLSANGHDFYLVKTDSNGNLEWNKTYGRTGDQTAYCMVQSHEGGYVIAGTTNYYPDPYIYNDVYVVKTDALGNLLWNKTYGGINGETAYSMTRTNDGGYVIAGIINYISSVGTGASDVYLIKIDGNGNLLLNKTLGGPSPDTQPDTGYSVIQTNDGGYAMAGSADRVGLIIKTDADGNLVWNKRFSSFQASYGIARAVIQTREGDYCMAGTKSSASTNDDFYLIKTNSIGDIIWSRIFGGNMSDEFASMIQTNDGGYALIGYGPDYSSQNVSASGASPLLIKTDADGNMVWNKTFAGYGTFPQSIIQTSDEGYAIVGLAWPNDFFLIKTVAYSVPEFSSTLVLSLFITVTLLVTTVYLKKHKASAR